MNKTLFSFLAGTGILASTASVPALAENHGAMEMRYRVTLTNLTHHQPLSPPALVVHGMGYMPVPVGQPASEGLERLAEGGDSMMWLAEARMQTSVYRTQAGEMPIPPGGHAEFMLHVPVELAHPMLSGATMLVNTNDAFAALEALPLYELEVGASMHFTANVYDAGTEANSEAAGTLPGPADGGEGFNPARETMNRVSAHPGVVTRGDGLETSVLDESHRFLNPALAVTVTRMPDMSSETVLQFTPMQHQYSVGDHLRIAVEEMPSLRDAPTDLWFALQIPDGVIMYFTPEGLTPIRQPFKRGVAIDDNLHTLFDIVVPEGLTGAFTVYAAYGELDGERFQLHSSIARRMVSLGN